jgi:lipopolysaccharide export system permease protein
MAPIFAGALIATLGGLGIGELVPLGNQKRGQLLQEQRFARQNDRSNFAFLARDGRIYQIQYLRVAPPSLRLLQVERISAIPGVPNYVTHVATATFDSAGGQWKLMNGVMHIMHDSVTSYTFAFDSLLDRGLVERPNELVKSNRTPDDMGFRELGRYIQVMERAGADVHLVRVERMLKIAIPITCLIIALFGAPLATSNQRGGASYGIGISLASTVLFLLLINLTRAFGGKGVMEPEIAAWLPSMVFGLFGIIMLVRVRT